MTLLKTTFVALLIALTATACGQTSGGASSAADGRPWGREFLSTSVTENGEPRPLVDGTRIHLDFSDDGENLGAQAGCNRMGGTASIEDGRLVVEEVATTEMGCDPARMAQDSWLADFLSSRPAFALSGAEMLLTGDGTEIRLADREVANPDRPLRSTRWVVDGVVEGEGVSSVPEGAEAFLLFSDTNEEEFSGNTGCNGMGGRSVVAEASISFSEVITTKIACENGRGDLERAVLGVLDGNVAYEIEADVLRLSHPDGSGLHLRALDPSTDTAAPSTDDEGSTQGGASTSSK